MTLDDRKDIRLTNFMWPICFDLHVTQPNFRRQKMGAVNAKSPSTSSATLLHIFCQQSLLMTSKLNVHEWEICKHWYPSIWKSTLPLLHSQSSPSPLVRKTNGCKTNYNIRLKTKYTHFFMIISVLNSAYSLKSNLPINFISNDTKQNQDWVTLTKVSWRGLIMWCVSFKTNK